MLDKYNKKKGGVDVLNRLLSNYRNLHANRKWWKSIFAEIIDISLTNSYLIFKYFNN